MAWAFHQAGIGTPFDYCYVFGICRILKIIVMQIIYGKNTGALVSFLSGTLYAHYTAGKKVAPKIKDLDSLVNKSQEEI